MLGTRTKFVLEKSDETKLVKVIGLMQKKTLYDIGCIIKRLHNEIVSKEVNGDYLVVISSSDPFFNTSEMVAMQKNFQ